MTPARFRKIIWEYYRLHKRAFPWRNTTDPYRITVSEIMLQQTQAPRVVSKYTSFLKKFPSWRALARAPLGEVLIEWKGLGYNRRAIALKKIAETVTARNGKLSKEPDALIEFPGIGPNTAGSISAFAFNYPSIFIETNIRTVFIHSFFKNRGNVHDKELFPLIEKTLDTTNPREWYYALMDYGAMLKKTDNASRKSAHYRPQPKFKGSHRELRALIVSAVASKKKISHSKLLNEVKKNHTATESSYKRALSSLEREGFLTIKRNTIFVSE